MKKSNEVKKEVKKIKEVKYQMKMPIRFLVLQVHSDFDNLFGIRTAKESVPFLYILRAQFCSFVR